MSTLKGFPPKLFIIGAQKAGTTQLSELLDQHDEVCLSSPKEPDFFTRNFGKGFNWYKGCFAQPENVLVDASTSYTSRPLPDVFSGDNDDENNPLVNVPERIHNASPEAKLIYIVRDPVKRTYSGYWHQVSAGYEKRPLLNAVAEDTSYFRISKYEHQLAYYLKFFDRKNVLVIKFEDLIKDPDSVLSTCFEFMDLPATQLDKGLHKNKSFQLTGPLAYINSNVIKVKPILKFARKIMPEGVVQIGQKLLTKSVPKITEHESKALELHFDKEVKKVFDSVNNNTSSSE